MASLKSSRAYSEGDESVLCAGVFRQNSNARGLHLFCYQWREPGCPVYGPPAKPGSVLLTMLKPAGLGGRPGSTAPICGICVT